jgi:hypothetical protein
VENCLLDPVAIDVKNQTTETGITISWPKLIGAVAVPALVFAYFLGSQGSDITGLRHDVDKSALRIDDIWKALPSLRASAVAAHPANASNQQAAKQLIIEAKQSKIPPIPLEAVQQAGSAFIAASNEPGAWNVALDFVAYRSSQNEVSANVQKGLPLPLKGTDYTFHPLPDRPAPLLYHQTLIGVPIEDAARLEDLNRPSPNQGSKVGDAWLRLEGGEIVLDSMRMRHVTLLGVKVHYSGIGPVILEDVTFVNCIFVWENTPPTRELSEKILSQVKIDFKAPV